MVLAELLAALAVACAAGPSGADLGPGSNETVNVVDGFVVSAADPPPRGVNTVDSDAPCPLGAPCRPHPIPALPFTHRGDTTAWPTHARDAYACAPDADERGPDVWYALTVPELGLLTVAVDDAPGDAPDVDVHLLDAAGACLARDDRRLTTLVRPGLYLVVVDTWAGADGVPRTGPYTLTVSFASLAHGPCALVPRDLRMRWPTCAPGVDCHEAPIDGVPARLLRTPALGPVVREAHLVTTGEAFPGDWPTSARDQLARHYARSEATTGYAMARTEPWAPSGEGGSRWGQGATGLTLPPEAEAWYVTMNWRDRPAPGTRVLLVNPENGRAVVAAAGYETGPGAPTAIAGAVEEVHHALGTAHGAPLVVGFLADATLPYGTLACWPTP